jgi:ubiquinone/menaquinone biosynthesis C-methylase UbiE
MRVLEIGSGTGEYTGSILENGSNVTASDISPNCIKLIENKYQDYLNNGTLNTAVANMENLPFQNNYFDVVTSAGSLSYGDNTNVLNEIYRVLKNKGRLIVVDSLNNNPIYMINRYVHFLKGNRSKSTLKRMPTYRLIQKYSKKYENTEVKYYGSITWLLPVLSKLFDWKKLAIFSNWIDTVFQVKRSAFKFIMVAIKNEK